MEAWEEGVRTTDRNTLKSLRRTQHERFGADLWRGREARMSGRWGHTVIALGRQLRNPGHLEASPCPPLITGWCCPSSSISHTCQEVESCCPPALHCQRRPCRHRGSREPAGPPCSGPAQGLPVVPHPLRGLRITGCKSQARGFPGLLLVSGPPETPTSAESAGASLGRCWILEETLKGC